MGLIVFLALVIGGIVAFNAYSRIDRLEADVKVLRRQLESSFINTPPVKKTVKNPVEKLIKETMAVKPIAPPLKSAALTAPSKTVVQESLTRDPKVKIPKPKKINTENLKPKRRSFEEEIGARWAVWVGGLTLGLGAIFLLRFAAEAGVFTPAMRVTMTVFMGLISLGAGEFLRRKDNSFFKDKLKIENVEHTAYIPGVLTGVGIFALFGAIYSAYALYDLIPAIAAFIGMAFVSFAALGLSWLQGPKVAGLGLVGSLVTPLLVSSDLSNYPMLLSYIALVTASCVALSRLKKWGWLAIAALFGAMFWMWTASFNASLGKAFWPWCVFVAALFAGAVWLSREDEQANQNSNKLLETDFDLDRFNGVVAVAWFALWAVIFVQLVVLFEFGRTHIVVSALAAGVLMGAGYLRKQLPQLILIGGLLGLVVAALSSFAAPTQVPVIFWVFITFSLAAFFMGLSALKSKEESVLNSDTWPAAVWASLSVSFPILMLLTSTFIKNYPDANTAFLMAVLLVGNMFLACVMPRSNPAEKSADAFAGPSAFYCIGAVVTYSLAAGYGFDGWPFSLAMMLGLPLVLAAYQFLKEPILKITTVGFAGLTAVHVLLVQLPMGSSVGSQIIFNALWFYLALPAVICGAGAWYLSLQDKKTGRSTEIWTELLQVFSLAFAALFAVFQVRHLMNGGDLLSNKFTFDEIAMQVLTGLCFTLGGLYLGRNRDLNNPSLLSGLAMGISGLTLALFVLGVCVFHNPLLNWGTAVKGGVIFNNLMLAFLLPSLALGAIGWLGRKTRSPLYLRICGGLSLVSFILYMTAMIRRGFSGDMISIFKDWPGDVELYTVSASWLILGVTLLALGMKLGRRDVRLASAFVITLTVLKAFLVDMASLEGALRAMSFVVLGVVLIVIGRVYQRILFSNTDTQEIIAE